MATTPQPPADATQPNAAHPDSPAAAAAPIPAPNSIPAHTSQLPSLSSLQPPSGQLSAELSSGSIHTALSFVKRVNLTRRKPTISGADIGAHTSSSGPTAVPDVPSANQPIITESEVIEPAAPGSNIGGPLLDDTLEQLVDLPSLQDHEVSEYATEADVLLGTETAAPDYSERIARGLLMVRNIIRSEPRYAPEAATRWLPLVRDNLVGKHWLIRAASATTLAAFAVSTPGRDAIQMDPKLLYNTMQLLINGIETGCQNSDTQYACLALANLSMIFACRQPLLRLGVLRHSAAVLRATTKWLELDSSGSSEVGSGSISLEKTLSRKKTGQGLHGAGQGGAGGAGTAGDGGSLNRQPILKAASYVVTLLTGWAVDAPSREQLQQHELPKAASDLQERCLTALGPDAPLSQRLALLVEAGSAAELLEDFVGGSLEPELMWELTESPDPSQTQHLMISRIGTTVMRVTGGTATGVHPHSTTEGIRPPGSPPKRLTGTGLGQGGLHPDDGGVGGGEGGVHMTANSTQIAGGHGAAGGIGGLGAQHVANLARHIARNMSVMHLPHPNGSNVSAHNNTANAAFNDRNTTTANTTVPPLSRTISNVLPAPKESLKEPLAALSVPRATTTTSTTNRMLIRRTTQGGLPPSIPPLPGASSVPSPYGMGGSMGHQNGSSAHLHPLSDPNVTVNATTSLSAISSHGTKSGMTNVTTFALNGDRDRDRERERDRDRDRNAPKEIFGGGVLASLQLRGMLSAPSAAAAAALANEALVPAGGGLPSYPSQSMLGLHFSSSVFNEASTSGGGNSWSPHGRQGAVSAAAEDASLGSSQVLRKPSDGMGPAMSDASSGGGRSTVRLPALQQHNSRNDNAAALSGRMDLHSGRQDLPFHLVRPIPVISAATPGKVSRISAQYGNVVGAAKSGSGGSLATTSSISSGGLPALPHGLQQRAIANDF